MCLQANKFFSLLQTNQYRSRKMEQQLQVLGHVNGEKCSDADKDL